MFSTAFLQLLQLSLRGRVKRTASEDDMMPFQTLSYKPMRPPSTWTPDLGKFHDAFMLQFNHEDSDGFDKPLLRKTRMPLSVFFAGFTWHMTALANGPRTMQKGVLLAHPRLIHVLPRPRPIQGETPALYGFDYLPGTGLRAEIDAKCIRLTA